MASFTAVALGVLAGSPSNFESGDGNMVVDTGGNNDWKSVAFHPTPDDFSSNGDDSFTSGQKQDTPCPEISGHKNPPKDDFKRVARFSEVNNTTGHTYLYGATVRVAANGNASENIELRQGTGGLCAGSTTQFERVAGDRLITVDYTGGGTSAEFHVLTWVTSGACFVGSHSAPCWGATVEDLGPNAAEGEANQSPIPQADNPITNEDLVAGQFAEFGIDLSAGSNPIVPPGTCSPFAETIWGSRASGSSFVSTTKDVVNDTVAFSNCGTIKIIKQTNPRGLDQKFDFTSNLKPNSGAGGDCSGVDASGNFCLNDKNNTTGNSTANTVSENNLSPGTYTITEGADPTGFEFDSVSCSPQDDVTVTGKEVSIDLGANDVITCTYVNDQALGAIEVTKTATKGSVSLEGATFSVKDSGGNAVPGSPLTTGANGKACVDGLAFGTYKVKETKAPTGYDIDDTSEHNVTVNNGADCDDATFGGETISFADTPLTDLTVDVKSQASGGTKSAVKCVNSASADIGDSPQPPGAVLGDFTTYADPVKLEAKGLRPGTYTCTVSIDP